MLPWACSPSSVSTTPPLGPPKRSHLGPSLSKEGRSRWEPCGSDSRGRYLRLAGASRAPRVPASPVPEGSGWPSLVGPASTSSWWSVAAPGSRGFDRSRTSWAPFAGCPVGRTVRYIEVGSWSLGRAGARCLAAARVVEARAAGIRTCRNGFSSVVATTGAFWVPLPGHCGDGCSPSAVRTGSVGPTSSSPELGGGLQGRRSRTFGRSAWDGGVRIGPEPGSSAESKACPGISRAGAPRCGGPFGPGTVAFEQLTGFAAITTKPMSALVPVPGGLLLVVVPI
jgi:hypothetical protein